VQTLTILQFIEQLHEIRRDMEVIPVAIVAKAAGMIAKQAKAQLGHEHEMWPPLAPSTLKDKEKHGWPSPSPLLRTGAMRDSIEWSARATHHGGAEAVVGSNDPKALWHELGTSRIPPRSFLVSSAISCEPKIVKMAARMAIAMMMRGAPGSSYSLAELRELLEMAKRTWEHVRDEYLERDEYNR
jgi:hypothetical protein